MQRGGAAAVLNARRQLELGSGGLRSLDAVHLASARRLGDELRAVVTYDVRMQAAAEALGMPTTAPA